ncbi:hypothetical protein KIN20_003113 [Parelaphostrongylus tenuis]|uniref:Uncharacterized protein n=1 Tax=Parelaphostrongylus tenuis TaxID=148309 RepID=A0AAD5MF61_PARTN|nr:hypothetical protein KIN20_003113 [Parelaphostrongylus tenuis]
MRRRLWDNSIVVSMTYVQEIALVKAKRFPLHLLLEHINLFNAVVQKYGITKLEESAARSEMDDYGFEIVERDVNSN